MNDSTAKNRLQHESSPYLQQHAGNPVDWYPWGPEALEKSRSENRPIFLSIGYSACHWCHVMEHESFENADIAAAMNKSFVNIKVDREERPDLDQIYMNAVVAMTGAGGWPMSVFLTPKLEPFYGGTYWPPEPKFGRPGFGQVVAAVADAWQNRTAEIQSQAERLTETVAEMSGVNGPPSELTRDLLTEAARVLQRQTDRKHGGFGQAPKFPHPFDLRVLLRAWRHNQDADALACVKLTLDKMAAGGIYDHLGGGFHRYSTDARWLVPHFEKMLYDNALLLPVYIEAWQVTGDANYRRVIEETLQYTLREMTQPGGGFYSTQDADSEGVEGKFFVWTAAEITELLGADRAKLFNQCYDVSPQGNWEETNILNRVGDWSDIAQAAGCSLKQLENLLSDCRRELFAVREERIAPARDDKVLASWNGLMISAMALAGRVFANDRYTKAAVAAATFVLGKMHDEHGRLLHAWKDGTAKFPAYLDDYACMADGLTELFQTTSDVRWLNAADALVTAMVTHFADTTAGGFFYTADDHEQLLVRQKDSQDNATPSGNAMAATALLKLSRLTGNTEWEQTAVGTLELLSPLMSRAPSAAGQALIALDFLLGPTQEIVIAPGENADDVAQVVQQLHGGFLPNHVLIRLPLAQTVGESDTGLHDLVKGKSAIDSTITAYICEQGHCEAPAIGVAAVAERLQSL